MRHKACPEEALKCDLAGKLQGFLYGARGSFVDGDGADKLKSCGWYACVYSDSAGVDGFLETCPLRSICC